MDQLLVIRWKNDTQTFLRREKWSKYSYEISKETVECEKQTFVCVSVKDKLFKEITSNINKHWDKIYKFNI